MHACMYLRPSAGLIDIVMAHDIAVINHGEIIACDKTKNLIKLFGERQLIITANHISSALMQKLKVLSSNCEVVNGNKHSKIKIRYKYEDMPLGGILAFCMENKIEIIDIQTKESDLEDIFKLLIKSV